MKTLYVCTTSSSKLAQFVAFFAPRGYDLRQVALEIPEMQSVDASSVVSGKLRMAAQLTALRPLVVDDAGIEIPDLEGFPGALLKPILEHGQVRLLRKLTAFAQEGGRAKARLVSAIAVDTGSTLLEGQGRLDGMLDFRDESRWEDRDCTAVFFPDGEQCSLMELKQRVGEAAFSHRFEAMEKVYRLLELERPESPALD